MDIATILGIVLGLAIVVAAIFMGGSFGMFVNVPSLFIVVGGMIAATILRFELSKVMNALGLGSSVAFKTSNNDPRAVIDEIIELASIMRKSGPLGLESVEIKDPLLAKGMLYVADGYEAAFISETMERENDLTLERLTEGQRIYKAMGDSAPAFGMIGTLVGLVQMLSTMEDPSTIGPSMAVALLTTLYGAMISNMIALPISDKLSAKAKVEALKSALAIDGVLQIRENKSPDLIKEVLMAYLPEKSRAGLIEEEAA